MEISFENTVALVTGAGSRSVVGTEVEKKSGIGRGFQLRAISFDSLRGWLRALRASGWAGACSSTDTLNID